MRPVGFRCWRVRLRCQLSAFSVPERAEPLLLLPHLACHQQPQQALGQGLTARLGAWKDGLQLRDGVAPEANALLRVQQRRLPQHTLQVHRYSIKEEPIAGHVGLCPARIRNAHEKHVQICALLEQPAAKPLHIMARAFWLLSISCHSPGCRACLQWPCPRSPVPG